MRAAFCGVAGIVPAGRLWGEGREGEAACPVSDGTCSVVDRADEWLPLPGPWAGPEGDLPHKGGGGIAFGFAEDVSLSAFLLSCLRSHDR